MTQVVPRVALQRPEGIHLKYAEISGYKVVRKENKPLVTVTIAVHGDSLEAINDLFKQLDGNQDWFIKIASRTEHGELVDPVSGESYGPADPPSNGEQLGMLNDRRDENDPSGFFG